MNMLRIIYAETTQKQLKFRTMKIFESEKAKTKKYFFDNYREDMEIDVPRTAESLGVTRATIYNWIKEIKAK